MHSERVPRPPPNSSLSCVTIGFRCGGRHQTVFPSFCFSLPISTAWDKKCLVKSTNEFFFSCYCLRGSRGLDEDSTVSVEFEDLAQPLLGRGHPFFGPLA